MYNKFQCMCVTAQLELQITYFYNVCYKIVRIFIHFSQVHSGPETLKGSY